MRILLTWTFLLLFGVIMNGQQIHIVNSLDDIDDGDCNNNHCSLREAIIAANSNGVASVIWFVIDGEGPKVITLTADLPAIIADHLKIDGNTLAKNVPTKGRLVIDGKNVVNNGFTIDATDIEIYGLQMQGFVDNAIFINSPSMEKICRITIGRRKQGNIFLNNGNVLNATNINKLTFQANYVGTNLHFDPNLGNRNGILIDNDWSSYENAEIIIGGDLEDKATNYFVSTSESAIDISYQGFAKIEGNVFGTGPNGDENLGNEIAIKVSNNRGRIDIGGSETTSNIFAFNQNAVIVNRNNFVRVSENSFYCNSAGLRVIENPHPTPTIDESFKDLITGTGTAGDLVEIYLTDAATCDSEDCQGMVYLGDTRANLEGNWQFSAEFEYGQQLVALSRYNGRQSIFSACFRFCPAVVTNFATNTGPYCEEESIQLNNEIDLTGFTWVTDIQPSDLSFEWSGPGSFYATSQNPQHATIDGDYILQTFLLGCPSKPDTTSVKINRINAEIAPISTFCRAENIQLNSLVTSELNALNYNWVGPDNYKSTEANPTDISLSGTYSLVVSGSGCQSELATVNVINEFPDPISINQEERVCQGESISITVNGYSHYSWSGPFNLPCDTCPTIDFIPEQNGTLLINAGSSEECVSTAAIQIEVSAPIHITEEKSLCPGSNLSLLGQNIIAGGTYSETYQSSTGCDSTHTFIINELEPTLVNEVQTICTGEIWTQFGKTFSTSGIYEANFTASSGCDSTHILELRVLESPVIEEYITLCAGESMDIFGTAFHTTASVSKSFSTALGCDSLHTIHLIVNETYDQAEKMTLCSGETITLFNDFIVNESGLYQREYVSQMGCDSIVSYEVEFKSEITTSNNIQLCEGEAKNLFGEGRTFPVVISENFTNQSGCDSTHTIQYDLANIPTTEEFITICVSDAYLIAGEPINVSGTYSILHTSALGCDSSHLINLTVLEETSQTEDLYICEGESVNIFGEMVSGDGIYTKTFTNSLGCDSVHTINVIQKEIAITSEEISICAGESILAFGEEITSTTTLSKTFTTATGCDSIHTINVSFLDTITSESRIEICENSCFELYGSIACADKKIVSSFTANSGCDSIHTTYFNLVNTQESTKEYILCPGDSMSVFGEFVKEAGSYSATFSSIGGCDSTHHVSIQYSEPLSATVETNPTCQGVEEGSVALTVSGGMGAHSVTWNGTPMGAMEGLDNLPPGVYDLTISDFLNCQMTQSVTIEAMQTPEMTKEVLDVSCFGAKDGSIEFFSNENLKYSLNGAAFSEAPAYFDLPPDNYEIRIVDETGCEYSEQFTIVEPAPLEVTLPTEITINLGVEIRLEPEIISSNSVSYEWENSGTLSCGNCEQPTAKPTENTKYTLKIYDENNCESVADILLKVVINKGIYIPNVFSPNDDGRNDKFTVLAAQGQVSEVEAFQVYDRWGTLVYTANNFKPNDENFGWDGTYKGQKMDNGVFIYWAIINYPDGTKEQLQGDVTLTK